MTTADELRDLCDALDRGPAEIVRQAADELDRLRDALNGLKTDSGCWCDRYYDFSQCGHQKRCDAARRAAGGE